MPTCQFYRYNDFALALTSLLAAVLAALFALVFSVLNFVLLKKRVDFGRNDTWVEGRPARLVLLACCCR